MRQQPINSSGPQFRTKEDFDNYLSEVVEEARENMAERTLYNQLLQEYRNGAEELRFLYEMPYEQGLEWVKKAFIEYFTLQYSDPDRFPTTNVREMVRILRAYRKEKRKKTKEAI